MRSLLFCGTLPSMKFFFDWVVSAAVIFVLAYVLPGVSVAGYLPALGAAIVIGLVNATVKPLLIILTLPVTIITFGFFLLIINAFVIQLAAWLVPGFDVDGFWWALLFGIVLSLVHIMRKRSEQTYYSAGQS